MTIAFGDSGGSLFHRDLSGLSRVPRHQLVPETSLAERDLQAPGRAAPRLFG